jgi:pimeloyl-ACP methyl ester carboxylesterase
MFENFYLPLFITPLAHSITAIGSFFLTVNTRAHDYIIYCRRQQDTNSFTWERQGGSYEIFSNCLLDIEGWLTFSEALSAKVVLMGHSHGALKATYYAIHRNQDSRIIGIILLSPSDDIGLQERHLGSRYYETLTLARTMVNEGKGDELMPNWAYGDAVSATMYVDMFSEKSDLAIFRFDEPSVGFKDLKQVRVPTLAVFGESDKATSSVSSQTAIDLIKASLTPNVPFEGRIVRGGNHHYLGHEREMAEYITDWATRVILR